MTDLEAPGTEPLRWGVVGTGEVSRSFSADLTEATGSRRRAVASREASRASDFAREFGFDRAHGSLDALLQDGEVDVVYVGTPHGTHHDIAVACLRAGKHVVVEKPLARNSAEVEHITSVAAEEGLFAMEGMWMKFSPLFRRVLADVSSGTIGSPRSVRASFGIPFPAESGSRWSATLGGSTLLDQGIYPVTLAMALFGPPTEIVARGSVRADGVDLADHITLEFSDGRYAQLAASMVDFCDLSATINGTEGWLTLLAPFWAGSRYRTHTMTAGAGFLEGVETSVDLVGNGFTPMIEHVNDAIRSGRRQSAIHPLSASLEVFHVLDAIRSQLRAQFSPAPQRPSATIASRSANPRSVRA